VLAVGFASSAEPRAWIGWVRFCRAEKTQPQGFVCPPLHFNVAPGFSEADAWILGLYRAGLHNLAAVTE
jgi:hypothetical protein